MESDKLLVACMCDKKRAFWSAKARDVSDSMVAPSAEYIWLQESPLYTAYDPAVVLVWLNPDLAVDTENEAEWVERASD
jgi:hypothetical protein